MLAKSLVLTICVLASELAKSAEIDCNRRLDFNAVSNCCAKPTLNFEPFRPSCGRFMQDRTKNMSPCLFDCIFNVSQAMNGMEVNVDNAQRMLEQLLGNNKDFVDVYLEALQNCTANTSEMLKYKRRRYYGSENCTLQPLYLGMCTVEHVFVNCPSASWTRSKICEDALEHKLNCQCDITGRSCRNVGNSN